MQPSAPQLTPALHPSRPTSCPTRQGARRGHGGDGEGPQERLCKCACAGSLRCGVPGRYAQRGRWRGGAFWTVNAPTCRSGWACASESSLMAWSRCGTRTVPQNQLFASGAQRLPLVSSAPVEGQGRVRHGPRGGHCTFALTAHATRHPSPPTRHQRGVRPVCRGQRV